jgi:hypothetical protein
MVDATCIGAWGLISLAGDFGITDSDEIGAVAAELVRNDSRSATLPARSDDWRPTRIATLTDWNGGITVGSPRCAAPMAELQFMAAADLQAARALAAVRWASLSDVVRLSLSDVIRLWIRLSVHASARLSGPLGHAGRSADRTCSAIRLASRVTSVTCTATVGWQHDGVVMARSMANTFLASMCPRARGLAF